jgi:carboxypeptidase family protein
MRRNVFSVVILVGVLIALGPVAAWAQSSIVGVVKDSSGAVLPGVTVEASSPALIEKARSVVTDSQGLYRIIDLRPGVYSVTFTLSGFQTAKRDNIDLPAAFTATINGEMQVGSIAETLTVSGEAPVVDLRNSGRQQTVSQELISSVPTGSTPQSYAVLLPSVTQGLGTITTSPNSFRWADMSFRGARGASTSIDGFDTSHRLNGEGSQYQVNEGMVQEIVVSLGSAGAETQSSGVTINVIPKSGGNRFSGSFAMHYANDDFVAANITPELQQLGITTQSVRKAWDYNPAIGGPIARDKAWFFASYRNLGNATDTGIRRDLDPLDWVYTADTSRLTDSEQQRNRNYSGRLTYQLGAKNTIIVHGDHNPLDWNNRGGTTGGARTLNAPEATVSGLYNPQYVVGAGWKSPVSNKLYVEGGVTATKNKQWFRRNDHDALTGEPVSPDLGLIAAQDTNTGWLFRGSHFIGNFNNTFAVRPQISASYVTGSHTAKVGSQIVVGKDQAERYRIGDYIVRLSTNVPGRVGLPTPQRIEIWGPENRTSRLTSVGFYGQDQWVLKRATLNLGLRYDYVVTSADPQVLPANTMLPERTFAGVDKIIHYHDLSPRIGIAYDLFGNNRTAVKAALNRYLYPQDFAGGRHPTALAVPNTLRDFTDLNGNFIPDCDHRNLFQNGECGTADNTAFGSQVLNPPQFDPDVDGGFMHRAYSWEVSAGVQHHVMQGLGVEFGFYRRRQGNQKVTDNLKLKPEDFREFCVMVPTAAQANGHDIPGAGQQLCGFYDFTQQRTDLVGQVQNYTTLAKNFGDEIWVFTGFEFNVNARMPGGLQLTGGTITQRTRIESCYTVDSPMWSPTEARGELSTGGIAPALSGARTSTSMCKNLQPFQTTMKLMGTYPLPVWDIQVSGSIQALPGPALNGTRTYSRAEILGLPAGTTLSAATLALTVVEPNINYGPYVNKVDMRVSKLVRVGAYRLTGGLDIFNVLNSSDILAVNTTVGTSWLNPTQVLGGRLFRVSGRLDF